MTITKLFGIYLLLSNLYYYKGKLYNDELNHIVVAIMIKEKKVKHIIRSNKKDKYILFYVEEMVSSCISDAILIHVYLILS